MLKVNYPDTATYPEGEKAVLRAYKFWSLVKHLRSIHFYPYPIVYTDGLISSIIEDSATHTPWGIEIGGSILQINAPTQQMTPDEAKKYCKSIIFAGQRATLPHIETLRHISKFPVKLNQLLQKLKGIPFTADSYLSCTSGRIQDSNMSINFAKGSNAISIAEDKTLLYSVRPVINTEGAYS